MIYVLLYILLVGFIIQGVRRLFDVCRSEPRPFTKRLTKSEMLDAAERELLENVNLADRISDPELQEIAKARAMQKYMEKLGELINQ